MVKLILPSEIQRQWTERHIIEAEDGQIFKLDKTSRKPRDGIATKIGNLKAFDVLYRFRYVRNIWWMTQKNMVKKKKIKSSSNSFLIGPTSKQ